MLPTLTPTGCISAAVGGLPMGEQNSISHRNGNFKLTGEISALIQTGVTSRNVKARSNVKRDVDLIDTESDTDARIGVVTDINTI